MPLIARFLALGQFPTPSPQFRFEAFAGQRSNKAA
jgi:hypothetical protein